MTFFENPRQDIENERVPLPSYEKLKALEILVEEGQVDKPAVFELFTRSLDPIYNYGIVAGVTKATEQLLRYSYTRAQLDHLSEFVSLKTIDYLSDYRFKGSLFGIKEGEFFFPFTPVLTAHCTMGEGVVAATLLENIITSEANTATACSHLTKNVGAIPVIDDFSSREFSDIGIETARTAHMTGFIATTNLKSSQEDRIPVYDIGTRTHFSAFSDEIENYEVIHKHFKSEATYLVNVDSISESIEKAAHASNGKIHAVRVESKHYSNIVPAVREHLDILGAEQARIVLSGQFDHQDTLNIKEKNLPIDVLVIKRNPSELHRKAQFSFEPVSVEKDGIYARVATQGDEDSIVFGGAKTPLRGFDDSWELDEERLTTTDYLDLLQGVDLESTQDILIKKGSLANLSSLKKSREQYKQTSEKTVSQNLKVLLDGTIIWER